MRKMAALMIMSLVAAGGYAQDVPAQIEKLSQLPSKFLNRVESKIDAVNRKIEQQSQKYLSRLQKAESKVQARLAKLQPDKAQALLRSADDKYLQLQSKMKNPIPGQASNMAGEYMPYFDSLRTSLNFLSTKKDALNSKASDQLASAQSAMGAVQSRLEVSDEIYRYIHERQQQYQEQLSSMKNVPTGLLHSLDDYKKQAYYYNAQMQEYKSMLNEQPDKFVKKGLDMLAKLPEYQKFMSQYSQLSSLFSMPGANAIESLAGMQTRDAVLAGIQSSGVSAGNGGMQQLQQSMQTAQAQFGKLKDKLTSMGKGKEELDMPDFKPNNLKVKPFWSRLEYGVNLQSSKSNPFFPQQTEFAGTVGYRISEKSVVGIGASYNLGWGKDIKHVSISNQGIGLRSYVDVKIKASFYGSGGFEYNYALPFNSVSQLKMEGNWQQSALFGITKIISLKGAKWLKKSKVQILYDFLYQTQTPQPSSPIKLRMGYTF